MTAPTCVEPAQGERLLEAARDGARALSLEHRLHLESCAACQTSLERIRRMAACWLAMEPMPREVAVAYARFSNRIGDSGRTRMVSGAITFAILLAAAAAFAGVRTLKLRLGAPRANQIAPAVVTSVSVRGSRASQGGPPNGAPVASSTLAADSDGVLPAPPAAEPPSAPIGGVVSIVAPPAAVSRPAPASVATLNPTPRPPVAVPEPAVVDTPIMPSPAPEACAAPAIVPEPPIGWAASAEALRVGDYGAAERAFGELARSADPRTRDEARLARAQVWLAQGRIDEAQPELESLAAAAATPLVRSRAAERIRKMRGDSQAAGARGTNLP